MPTRKPQKLRRIRKTKKDIIAQARRSRIGKEILKNRFRLMERVSLFNQDAKRIFTARKTRADPIIEEVKKGVFGPFFKKNNLLKEIAIFEKQNTFMRRNIEKFATELNQLRISAKKAGFEKLIPNDDLLVTAIKRWQERINHSVERIAGIKKRLMPNQN